MPQLRKFTGVGTGIIVGATFATIVGVGAHGGDATKIHACVDQAGNIKIVGPAAACKQNEVALDWNVQGVQGVKGDQGIPGVPGAKGDTGAKGETGEAGPPGTFTGSFTSPNGSFTLAVTDNGIELTGPLASIRLGNNGIEIESDRDISIQSAADTDIRSASEMSIRGATTVEIEAGGVLHLKGASIQQN